MTDNEPVENTNKLNNIIFDNGDFELLKNEIKALKVELEKRRLENETLKKTSKNNSTTQMSVEIENIINENSVEYVRNAIFTIKLWNFLTGSFITLKYLMLILFVPTFTFASSTYTQYNLNFAAGILSLIGISFEKLGKYCETNSKRKVEKLNKILQEYGNNMQIQDESHFEIDDEQTNKRDFKPRIEKIRNNKICKTVCSIAFGE